MKSELLYRLFCKCAPSAWWPGYLGKAVQEPIFCKWAEGPASGDVLLPPPWKSHLATQGFPQDVWNKYSGWSVALHGAGHRCQGCAHHQHHCCSQFLSKTTLVNALKTGGKKAAGKVISSLNTCKWLYLNFTHGNSFSPRVSDIFCHKKDTVKAKVFWKTCQPLPRDPNSRAQQPLSSQRLPSHEPCSPLLTPMVGLSPRCCQSV